MAALPTGMDAAGAAIDSVGSVTVTTLEATSSAGAVTTTPREAMDSASAVMEAINQQSPSSPYSWKIIEAFQAFGGEGGNSIQDLLEQHRILRTPLQTGRDHHRCPEAVSTLHCTQDQKCHPQKETQSQDIPPEEREIAYK